jgi:hypothetical protein
MIPNVAGHERYSQMEKDGCGPVTYSNVWLRDASGIFNVPVVPLARGNQPIEAPVDNDVIWRIQ